MGFPEVRSEVDSNLSTTTCNLPPESFAISLNRPTMTSRPQPIPRFESVHEESVSLVPHATSCPISARIDFSSTVWRAIAPADRGKIFGWGIPCAGSAGSRDTGCCAEASIVPNKRMTRAKRIELNEHQQYRTCLSFMICDTSFDLAICKFGILSRIPLAGAHSSLLFGTSRVQAVGEVYAELPLPV